MYYIDYHLHTKYSYDSEESLENICNKAIEMGISEIAFCDHLDIVTNKVFNHNIEIEKRFKEISYIKSLYSNKITIKNGIELGQPQANKIETKKFYNIKEFDFIIGSIHNMKNDVEIEFYDYYNNDCLEFYSKYIDELIEISQYYDFDVLGHVTLPLRYMPIEISKNIDINIFEEKYRYLFDILIQKDKGIELNTSGLRKGNGETSPSPIVLKWYKECGGELITVGSDAHSQKNVAFGINKGYEILESLEFKYITVYEKRKPSQIQIK